LQSGEIAFLRDLQEYLPVPIFPEKLVPVRMQAERLVELKVKRDERHSLLLPER